MEATGFMFNSKAGSMFANVKGAAHELAAAPAKTKRLPLAGGEKRRQATLRGHASSGGGDDDEQDEADRDFAAAAMRRRKDRAGGGGGDSQRPRPFPERVGAQPVHVACCDTPCGQCGARGTDGTIYGDTYYCEVCWPLLGLGGGGTSSLPATAAAVQVEGQTSRSGSAQPAKPKMTCSSCGAASHSGQWGGGAYSSAFYCSGCWRRWQGGGRPLGGGGSFGGASGFHTDVSTTDNDLDSGTDATIINSDVASATDGSDAEWW